MTNPFTKRINHKKAYGIILIFLAIATAILRGPELVAKLNTLINPAEAKTITATVPVVKTVTKTKPKTDAKPTLPKDSQIMHVTAFSSVECHSGWCNDHRGKGRLINGKPVVAINVSKFGSQWSKVYIPVYGKTYDIARYNDNGAPATASGTDIDIWFGDDHEGALKINTNVLVYLIK